jgi:hypothetical protein
MTDYYDLLGVPHDASKDQIREAYQARREAISGDDESVRRQSARLNEAWQTLADPYQRGRYDEARAHGETLDEVEVVEPADDRAVQQQPRRRGLFSGPDASSRQLPPPTITLPSGTRFPATRTRMNAMFFDLAVLLLLFIGVQFVGQALIKAQWPAETDRLSAVSDAHQSVRTFERDLQRRDNARTKLGEAATAADRRSAQSGLDSAEKRLAESRRQAVADLRNVDRPASALDDTERLKKSLDDESTEIGKKVAGGYYLMAAAVVVLGLAYLIGSSLPTGATVGKRIRKIRVVGADGSKPPARQLLSRYGPMATVVGVGQLMPALLMPIVVLVIVGVLTWVRNPNQQGWHDRLAGTLVVEDVAPGS